MEALVILGATALSLGLGLLLMWGACMAFFGVLMRARRHEGVAAEHVERGNPLPGSPIVPSGAESSQV